MVDNASTVVPINDGMAVQTNEGENDHGRKNNSDLLLTDIIEELGEYDRVHQLYNILPAPSSPSEADVKGLYLEDLVKIQEKLRDEDSAHNLTSCSTSIQQDNNVYHMEHSTKLPDVHENQTRPELDEIMKCADEINAKLSSSPIMCHLNIEDDNTGEKAK